MRCAFLWKASERSVGGIKVVRVKWLQATVKNLATNLVRVADKEDFGDEVLEISEVGVGTCRKGWICISKQTNC